MNDSLLLSIKTSVQQFAQVISTILEMDVDIVDENLIRVAGTRLFSRNINKSIDNQGNAFKKVLNTKEALILEKPGKEDVCQTCISKEVCAEKFEICYPILLDRKVIGVISLAVFDNEKRAVIVEKLKNYIDFLEQIAGLIAAKAAEHRNFQQQVFSLELLKNLLDRISEGVIVFDQNRHILHINMKCEQILGNRMEQLVYMNKIKQFTLQQKKSSNPDEMKYMAKVKSKKIMLIGRIYPIVVDNAEVGTVFVFQDVPAFQKGSIARAHRGRTRSNTDLTVSSRQSDSKPKSFNLDQVEKDLIQEALNTFGNSTDAKRRAAQELGLSTATLYRKLQKHNISETEHNK